MVILDEPNANLDEIGELALAQALLEAKRRKIATIVISHRPSVLNAVDKILIMQNGAVAAFGTKEEILPRINMSNNSSSFHLIDDKKDK